MVVLVSFTDAACWAAIRSCWLTVAAISVAVLESTVIIWLRGRLMTRAETQPSSTQAAMITRLSQTVRSRVSRAWAMKESALLLANSVKSCRLLNTAANRSAPAPRSTCSRTAASFPARFAAMIPSRTVFHSANSTRVCRTRSLSPRNRSLTISRSA